MKKSKRERIGLFGSIRVMTMSAMLVALSAVIGYVCKTIPALNLGTGLRITFENLPIILAGVMFGPVVGGCVGGVADLLSCLFSGQTPIPLVLVGSVSVGIAAGVFSRFVIRKKGFLRIAVAEVVAHLIGSVIIKTAALYSVFGPIVLYRIPISIGIVVVEILLIYAMYKNKNVRNLIDSGIRRD